jgi:hypothetical protein
MKIKEDENISIPNGVLNGSLEVSDGTENLRNLCIFHYANGKYHKEDKVPAIHRLTDDYNEWWLNGKFINAKYIF